jgi:hypothetical protein
MIEQTQPRIEKMHQSNGNGNGNGHSLTCGRLRLFSVALEHHFLASTGKRFLTLGAIRTYGQVIFECISDTLREGNGAIQYRDRAFAQEGQIREPR